MKIPEGLEYIFATKGAKRWLARPRGPRANALFPKSYSPADYKNVPPSLRRDDLYVYSDSPEALALTEALARLGEQFPVDVLASGYAGPTAVPSGFGRVLAVSGCGMDPLPLPLMSNVGFTKSQGVAQGFREADIPFFKELMKLHYGAIAPAPLHIRKEASTNFPFFTIDNMYKKLSFMKIVDNCDHFLGAWTGKSNSRVLLDEYHTLPVSAVHERQQPNSIDDQGKPKKRFAPTEQEARSGDYSGGTVADLSVHNQDGQLIEGHYAMRRRTVFGPSGPANYFLTAIWSAFRAVYLKRFEFTYKTRGAKDKEERASRFKYVVGCDVKSMDTLIPAWFLEAYFDELCSYLDERVVEVARQLAFATYVVPSPWRNTADEYNPVFGPDPLSLAKANRPGLASGIAMNPDIGKLWMTFVYTIGLRDVGALHSVSQLEKFLQGEHPDCGLLDMSDDATLLTNSPTVAARLRKLTSPYAVLEPETPVIFLGDVFAEVSGRRRVFPNPVTYIVNAVAREDSIAKKDVVTYAEGVQARVHQYSATPIFSELNEAYEALCRRHLGFSPLTVARTLARYRPLSDVDAMVRENPAYLYYRVDPEDVSKELLDELVATVPAADFFNKLRHLYKVPSSPLEALL